MGSPLGLTLAQIFIIVLKVNGFKILCSIDVVLIPLLQFSSPYHADEFKEYLSSKHLTVTFSIDKEKECWLPFYMFTSFLEIRNLQLWKMNFSRIYTNFKIFMPETYKIGLTKSLLFRCFSLYSDFIKFYHEVDTFVRAVSRKRLKIGVEELNLVQIVLDLCWGEFLRETHLKSTRKMMSALFLPNFFSANLNKLYIIRFEI